MQLAEKTFLFMCFPHNITLNQNKKFYGKKIRNVQLFSSLCGMSRAAVGGTGGGRGSAQVRMRGPAPHPIPRELRVAGGEAPAGGGRGEDVRGRAEAAWPRGNAPQGRSGAAGPSLPGVWKAIYRGKSMGDHPLILLWIMFSQGPR